MDNQIEYITPMINLHRGLDRQGPGDVDFSRNILQNLPSLPPQPRIADLGCGSGAGALLLAKYYQCNVMAVDASPVFIQELTVRAKQMDLEHLITPIQVDMAKLEWPVASIDLLWSEGAAYNLGFEQALRLWRPLLANHGIAVVSELSWFTDEIPEPAIAYWHRAYPMIGTEAENIVRAASPLGNRSEKAGFSVLSTHRLPSSAWWINYYEPLRERIEQIEITPATQSVIREIEDEMALFEKFSNCYGYTFYLLKAKQIERIL
jgi:SAM-dependent methyltransferase